MSEATTLATIVLPLVPLRASPTGSWAASASCSCSTNLPARTKASFPLSMDLLNTYSRSEILIMRARDETDSPEMRLALPDGFGAFPSERYHIVTIDALHVRAVLPASRLRIVATANQGEGYEGHEFTDPAFCRRWYHWLHLPGYNDDVIRDILAERLAIKRTSPLINAMLQVDKEIAQYQADEDALKFILCLPLMINWGEQTLWYVNHPSSTLRGKYREAFELAARNTWLNRVCPYKGGNLDEEIELSSLKKCALPHSHPPHPSPGLLAFVVGDRLLRASKRHSERRKSKM